MTTATTLSVVPALPPYPEFEGHQIEYVVTKVSGTVKVPDDAILHMDDRIRVVSEWRVVSVQFKMDKAGKWYREQIINHYEQPGSPSTVICPWDPSDPTDNGILHTQNCPVVP